MDKNQYINRERSLIELGTDIEKLKPSSCKPVYRICSVCNTEEIRPYRNVNFFGQTKCSNCSNKINANTNKHIRSEKIKAHHKIHGHPRLGVKHTEESKKKMSENKTPRTMSEEERRAIGEKSKGEKNYFFGKFQKGELNPFYGKRHSEESLAKMREIQKKIARRGKNCNLYGKNYYAKHTKFISSSGVEYKMKSSWEIKVAELLDSKNIKWEYEKTAFPVTYEYEGTKKEGTYTPDFFMSDVIWEVKGYWRKDAKVKFQAFLAQYPDLKIEVIDKQRMKELGIRL